MRGREPPIYRPTREADFRLWTSESTFPSGPPIQARRNPLGGENPYQRGLLKRKGVRASQTGPGPAGTLVTAGQTVGATIQAPTRGTQVMQHFHRAFRQGTIGRIRLAQGKARRDAQGRFL